MGVLFRLRPRNSQVLEGLRARDGNSGDLAVLAEPTFHAALRREQRRAERSERAFLLMLVALGRASVTDKGTEHRLKTFVPALAASVRETDMIGWHRQGEVLGAIFTELGAGERSAVIASIKQKVTTLVDKHLLKTNAKEINLSFYFFPVDSRHEAHLVTGLNAELYPVQQSGEVQRTLKRIIDVSGSTLALLVLAPVFLAVGVLIKLTSQGPVLFRQPRVGQHGKEFIFLKFRSMYVNNDATPHKEYVSHFIAGKASMRESADGKSSAYKIIDDPRVTPLGQFLRKTSLDELPQLINVLKGEMSLVGPRPPIPYELPSYEIWHHRRFVDVKPGITGLWQVYGRSRTSFDEMVRLDLRYARGWSLALDFLILLKTPQAVLSGTGAY